MRDYTEIMFRVVEETLRRTAFAFVSRIPTSTWDWMDEPGCLGAEMSFVGSARGRISIAAHERLVRILASNMMAKDEDDPELSDHTADALGEILNMICGGVLPEIQPTTDEFQIGLPCPVLLNSTWVRENWAASQGWSLNLDVEGHPMCLWMELQKEAQE